MVSRPHSPGVIDIREYVTQMNSFGARYLPNISTKGSVPITEDMGHGASCNPMIKISAEVPMDATPACGRNKDSISLAAGVVSAMFHVRTQRCNSGEVLFRDAMAIPQGQNSSPVV